MPWVEFTRDLDFRPQPEDVRHHIAYKAGHVLNLPRAWADCVVAEGAARRLRRPPNAADARAIAGNGNRRPD